MTTKKVQAPCGSWTSPVSPEVVAAGGLRFSDLRADDGDLYWVERRSTQRGIGVLVRRRADGEIEDVTPGSVSVGTTVHEYGGAPYAVSGGVVIYSSRSDGSVWTIDKEGRTQRLVADNRRYADFSFDLLHNRVLAVCEDHARSAVRNFIVGISLDTGEVEPLAVGRDFYASPRVSPDGEQICWLAWDLPVMPWEWCELWRGDLTGSGAIQNEHAVVASKEESITQPVWSPGGQLFAMSDRTDFWNLYRFAPDAAAVLPLNEECATPAWLFGFNSVNFSGSGDIVVISEQGTTVTAHRVKTDGKNHTSQTIPVAEFDGTSALIGDALYVIGTPADSAGGVFCFNLKDATLTAVRTTEPEPIAAEMRSNASVIKFPRSDGSKGTAYFYAPVNPGFSAPRGEKPPLLVRVHGGPTASSGAGYAVSTQFWTTRGFGVLDVEYAGSTGLGRKERERLRHQWGIADVDDCVAAAQFVAKSGKADGVRLLITGGSAGGYVVLCALAFHPDVFAAGADYFGIADLALMQKTTHKFESGYNEFLLGSLDVNDPVYRERSPLTKVKDIKSPLIVLQGLDDAVVPPSNADVIVDALRTREIPCAAYYFAHEGHGFRDAENIVTAYRAELAFYRTVLNIPSDDPIVLDLGIKQETAAEAPSA